jgi:hypothetical protein
VLFRCWIFFRWVSTILHILVLTRWTFSRHHASYHVWLFLGCLITYYLHLQNQSKHINILTF